VPLHTPPIPRTARHFGPPRLSGGPFFTPPRRRLIQRPMDNPCWPSQPFPCRYDPRTISGGCAMPDTKVPPRVDDPGFWRFRADNARQMAQDMKQAEAKAIVLKIAEEYELVARLTEDLQHQQPAT
jgi:hypothetical protein